jgi:hypothetical protein
MRTHGALAAILLLTAHCGGTTELESADAAPPFENTLGPDAGPAAACTELAQAKCAKRAACTDGADNTTDYGDLATCVTRLSLSCTAAFGGPGAQSTVATNEACVNQLASLSCADYLAANYGAPCRTPGPGALGTACSSNSDCATYFCSNIRFSECGTCAEPPAAGSSCVTTNCGAGQSCVWSDAVVDVCEPEVAIGGTCGEGAAPGCAADLYCARDEGAPTGTCYPALETIGAGCYSANPMNVGCDTTKGLGCTGTGPDYVCAAIHYVGDGMPCGNLADGSVARCAGGTCYTAGGPFTSTANPTGTCKALAADGAPCDTASGPGCMGPARCVTSGGGTAGTCTLITAAVAASCQ